MQTEKQRRSRQLNWSKLIIKGMIANLESLNKNNDFVICSEESFIVPFHSDSSWVRAISELKRIKLIGIEEIMEEKDISDNQALRFLAIRKWKIESEESRIKALNVKIQRAHNPLTSVKD